MSRNAQLKLGVARWRGDELDQKPTEILIFEDGGNPKVERLKSSKR